MLQTRVRSGELDRRVIILKKVTYTPATNEDAITSWQPIATVWARKSDYQGSEHVIADRLTFSNRTVFTIRHRTDVNTEVRIVCDTRVYTVVSVTETASSRRGYIDVATLVLDTELYT